MIPRVVPVLAAGLASQLASSPWSKCENGFSATQPKSRVVFLGTGSSTGCPRPLCPLTFSSSSIETPSLVEMRQLLLPYCRVSNIAMEGGNPKTNRNYRNNPSLLISRQDSQGRSSNIIIDVGKTFREGALRWLPDLGVTSIDGIVLTHQHMDAAGGLDDVRGFQKWMRPRDVNDGNRPRSIPVPLHLSEECYEDLQKQFPWLFSKASAQPVQADGKPVVQRHVASFDVRVFKPFEAFEVDGLRIIPLPVMHGEDFVSFGFAFTIGNKNVVYLSDISRMLPETLDYIDRQLPPTDILVLDSLHPVERNAVHFTLEEAVALSKEIPAKQIFLVGMNCDSFLPHDDMNVELRKRYGNIQLAHDGLVLETS